MTKFKWQIISMPTYSQINGQSNIVFEVNWKCLAQNGTITSTSYGTVPVSYTTASSFTPYDQLTQEQVWEWVNPNIDHSEIELNLQNMIDSQKNTLVSHMALPFDQ